MRAAFVLTLSILAGTLSGCQQMLDSERLGTGLDEVGATCHTNAGTYHLPRRLISVFITGSETGGYAIHVNPSTIDSIAIAPKYVADRNEIYCLDFLLSASSDDRIGIQRNKEGLLERIFTNTKDKSAEIIKDTIQGVADLVASEQAGLRSGRRNQIADAGATVIASFEFDPFVEREAREINLALREFGYCLFLDRNNDPFVPAWSPDICREIVGEAPPRRNVRQKGRGEQASFKAEPEFPRSGLPVVDPRPVSKDWQKRGVLYRPELSHSLMVMRKKDPGSRRSPWYFAGSERVVMPNASPAFVLEVKRAMFVNAETDVQFTNGMIKNISISKQSEMLAVSNLTVAVAQIVVSIPARSLRIFENRAENTEALIKANADLIDTLRQHGADADANAQARQGTSLILRGANLQRAAPLERQSQQYQHCYDQGGSPEFCRSRVVGVQQ